MDLPDGPLGDIDYTWYAGEARARILANPDFNHLDPAWLKGSLIAEALHAFGLCPSPKWDGKKVPKGARVDRPSYFWDWSRYDAYGTHTGPSVGLLELDIDEPAKFRAWVDGLGPSPSNRWASLEGSLTSYHTAGLAEAVRSGAAREELRRLVALTDGLDSSPPDQWAAPNGGLVARTLADSAEAVRSGRARGKLIFRFAADDSHPLARVGKAALRQAIGLEVFYGHGDPTIFGSHPDGPDQDYALSIRGGAGGGHGREDSGGPD
ncbi:MAG: hypothetical protein ACM35G_13965, partial [Planctomycetaceae bacterium]